jgi:phosphoglycolate phosphatase
MVHRSSKYRKPAIKGEFMLSYKGVIFDLDGTLLKTLDELAEITNRVIERHGFPSHPLDQYRFLVGDGAEILIRRALGVSGNDDVLVRQCLSEFLSIYTEQCGNNSRLYHGIKDLLFDLNRRGIKMAVLSNKPHDLTLRNIDLFLQEIPFALVFGQRTGIPKKPDPYAVHEILDSLGITPDECLYLGDTSVDMKTAVSAGVFPVGVLWGFRDREELIENGAKLLIDKPIDLIEFLDRQ